MLWREGYGKAPLRSLRKVVAGDLTPFVDSSLRYLCDTGVTTTTQLGYSYGADRALAMAIAAADEGVAVRQLVAVEPASLQQRSMLGLGRAFQACTPRFRARLLAATSPLLRDSRRTADEQALMVWLALLRPTNLAIARALARGGFVERAALALQAQADLKMHLAWGSQSELSDDSIMTTSVGDLQQAYPLRVTQTRLVGGDHSMADDIALHAAIMLQGVRMSTS
jgi:pimeloyl-ACP methyl ester carboxylesterase